MKKEKIIGNILLVATLISPMISFSLASIIGEAEIFGVAGIIRYSWVMLLFIPIGLLSILFGFKLKNNKQKYKKYFIISFICLSLLVIFGSYRFIFNSVVTYDVNEISIVEEKINFEIPDQVKVSNTKLKLYNISYAKIIDNESKRAFEEKIRNNQLWQDVLNTGIKGLLPFDVQYETADFDYFLFFNVTSDEYNAFPPSGQNVCIFVAYDCDSQRLIILNDYKINVN
ncbi:MAG: hypothetical protein IJO25_05320, partial [Clostridia bacterium]|nr:hypothetical protein [Clostridia bacterium]